MNGDLPLLPPASHSKLDRSEAFWIILDKKGPIYDLMTILLFPPNSQIIFEDDDIIAVNKPPGMVVHPAPGSWNGTFVNALVHHLERATGGTPQAVGFDRRMDVSDGEHNPGLRPGIVHRLDKGTTGVLLAAKNSAMQAKLADLFARRRVSVSRARPCCLTRQKSLATRKLAC